MNEKDIPLINEEPRDMCDVGAVGTGGNVKSKKKCHFFRGR